MIMEEWFGFYGDYSLRKFEEPRQKARCLFWIKKVDTGERNTTSYGNTYAVFKYEVFDKKVNPILYNKGDWFLMEISDNLFKNAFTKLHIKVKDPIGEVRLFVVDNDLYGVIQAIKMIDDFAQFENWQNYDLAEENKTLKAEIDELNQLIQAFKCTEFFKRIIKEIELAKEGGNELATDDILVQNELSSEFKEHWLE